MASVRSVADRCARASANSHTLPLDWATSQTFSIN